jgi:hypothetical protein
MAVIKANYVRRGKVGNAKAKENVRYIQHRPDKDNERVMRPLFTNDSPMTRLEAYQFIDEAPKGTHFYTIIINPDPATEDIHNSELTACNRNTNRQAALPAFAIFTFTVCSTWFVMTRNRSAC